MDNTGSHTTAPYQSHSSTSLAAAASIRPTAGTLRAKVLEYLELRGSYGATDEEQQLALGMDPSTQRPRRIELMKDYDLVFFSGKKRNTSSDHSANVWVLRQFAPEGEIAAQLIMNAANREAKALQDAAKKVAKEAVNAARITSMTGTNSPAAVSSTLPTSTSVPASTIAAPARPRISAATPRPLWPAYDPFDLNPKVTPKPMVNPTPVAKASPACEEQPVVFDPFAF